MMHREREYRDAMAYMDETSETSFINVMTVTLEHKQSSSAGMVPVPLTYLIFLDDSYYLRYNN